MPFQPKKITKEHVLKAIQRFEREGMELHNSTRHDVIINGKVYPPKEVMRYAHEEMNGEYLWELSGGKATNKWLRKMGFEIKPKEEDLNSLFLKLIEHYKSIRTKGKWDELYKWELVSDFKKYFDIEAKDFGEMLKKIRFSAGNSGRLLSTQTFMAKDTMIANQPDGYRKCFKILYDESKPLPERVEHFQDEVRSVFSKADKNPKHNPAHDERAVATFLCFQYPEKYSFYMATFYEKLCHRAGLDIPKAGEKYFHYLKLVANLCELIKQDKELLRLHEASLTRNSYREQEYRILAQDILYTTMADFNESDDAAGEVLNAIIQGQNENDVMKQHSLNTILYGPPGTGKTFNTKKIAVEIIDGEKTPVERDKLVIRYNELFEAGQINFVTFHQSMSYEDFVEGIKPRTNKETNAVEYDVEPGIFKSACDAATSAVKLKRETGRNTPLIPDDILDKAQFFKVSLGDTNNPDDDHIYDYCIENNCIAIGWGDPVDFTKTKEEKDIRITLESAGETVSSNYDFRIKAIKVLKFWMKEDDIVFVSYGNRKLRAIGRISGNYYFNSNSTIGYNQFRKVEWLYNDLDIPVNEVYRSFFTQQTIYQLSTNLMKKDYFRQEKAAKGKDVGEVKKYVLIIDEINRGNIAAILGELITLLEDDKRAGAKEALTVTLPYSKKKFSVPPNLYIVGTMNTADRSVEALDTALRRRFTFKEMMPQPQLLSSYCMLWRLWQRTFPVGWDDERWVRPHEKLLEMTEGKILNDKAYRNLENKDVTWDDGYKQNQFDGIVEFSGLDLKDLLETINLRIELLLDKDHLIGHSFFMEAFSWRKLHDVFQQKIIPQLKEYFYGDFGKIAAVLGTDFVRVEKKPKNMLFSVDGIEYDEEDKAIFSFVSFHNSDGSFDATKFKKAVLKLIQKGASASKLVETVSAKHE